MSETLFALVALMLTVFFAMTQQRGIVAAEKEIASIELEVFAHAAGAEVMQLIATKAFDAATSGANLQNVALTDLTLTASFGDGLACPSVCNDLDDFNQMQADTVFYEVGRDELDDPYGFDFAVTAEVHYVGADGHETTNRTWMKQVTVLVDQAVAQSEAKYLLTPIKITRQFSPQ